MATLVCSVAGFPKSSSRWVKLFAVGTENQMRSSSWPSKVILSTFVACMVSGMLCCALETMQQMRRKAIKIYFTLIENKV
jgi:hypothetical protein